MKKTIYVCDSCGAESDKQHAEIFGFDLCPDCTDRAAKLVTQFVKSSAKTGKIDWGKAQALRDAGWTLEAIAKEIGSTVSTVTRNTVTPKKRKRYEHESTENDPVILRSPELT